MTSATSIHEKQVTKYSIHLRGGELGFTFNKRSVKEFVDLYKTTPGYTQEVVHIPLLLTPPWLELSPLTTHSPGELGYIVIIVVVSHPPKNWWSITMGKKGGMNKISA